MKVWIKSSLLPLNSGMKKLIYSLDVRTTDFSYSVIICTLMLMFTQKNCQ